jgi:antirestriction protein ArdC
MQSPERYHRLPPGERERPIPPTSALHETLSRLEREVSRIHDSDSFRRYLDAQARFHRYSFGNVLLILTQRPDATRVAGYNTWQSVGRQVRRGERGIRILVPMHGRGNPGGDQEEEAEAQPRLFFGTGTVFDIAQTDGQPLPKVDVPVLSSEEGAGLYRGLELVARSEGLPIERAADELPEGTMGYYAPGSAGSSCARPRPSR